MLRGASATGHAVPGAAMLSTAHVCVNPEALRLGRWRHVAGALISEAHVSHRLRTERDGMPLRGRDASAARLTDASRVASGWQWLAWP